MGGPGSDQDAHFVRPQLPRRAEEQPHAREIRLGRIAGACLFVRIILYTIRGVHRASLVDGTAGRSSLGERRARVLTLLRTRGVPLGAHDVAAALGLHVNTARSHLDGLVESGLAERSTEDRAVPGRPRLLYAARPDSAVGPRSFELLAEILSGYLAAVVPDPVPAALGAGRAWGRHLADPPQPFQRLPAEEATDRLRRTLDAIGFDPELVKEAAGTLVRLRHCPFREVAERHPDVVCSIHLGLMQGALAAMEAPLEAVRLDPFVTPGLCVAHVVPV